jgi:hypothetical protein
LAESYHNEIKTKEYKDMFISALKLFQKNDFCHFECAALSYFDYPYDIKKHRKIAGF